jgi:hypothetical protein
MANDEAQGADGGQRHVPNIPAAQGMLSELLAVVNMFQQQ